MIYDNIKRNNNNIVEIKDYVKVDYVNGACVEILGSENLTYRVEFIDKKTNFIHYETELKTNHWAKSNIRYFVDWTIRVWQND